MLKTYIRIAFRSLLKKKLYSFINIIGLSLGTTLCLLVFLYVKHEYSRDEFHQNTDRLFVVQKTIFNEDNPKTEKGIFDTRPEKGYLKTVYLTYPEAGDFLEQIPEFVQGARVSREDDITVIREGEQFSARAHYVDKNFFELLSFPLKYGDAKGLLDRPDKVVLTEEMAVKYFGQEDPTGKHLELYNRNAEVRSLFEIGGVLKRVPSTSSLKFNFLLPIENFRAYKKPGEDQFDHNISFFGLLSENADLEGIHRKLDDIVEEKYAERGKAIKDRKGLSDTTPIESYRLINLSDIYFKTDVGESSHPLYAFILIGVALVVLLIGCINYVSISIASSSTRILEMGVRKVVGASRLHVFGQLYVEMSVVALVSGLLSYTLAQALLPSFNELTGVFIELTNEGSLQLLYFMIAFSILVSLLAGLYPALKLSRLRALVSLTGRKTYKANPHFMTGLVVVQFSLCIMFLSLGTVMQRQFSYISEKDLGFQEDALVQLNNTKGFSNQLKQQLLQHPAVKSVSVSSGIFTRQMMIGHFELNGIDYQTRFMSGDDDFFETFGMELVQGRKLDPEIYGEDANRKTCLVNETFWNRLQQDPEFDGTSIKSAKIVGVVKDFHFESLTQKIDNILISYWSRDFGTTFIRLRPEMMEAGIDNIKKVWHDIAPEKIYDLQFLSDRLAREYTGQRRWNQVIHVVSLLGVVIACMGLFGLSGINAMNRVKEVGIRKVLGASFKSIIYFLNKPVLWIVLISCTIAFPLANYFMERWLDSFVYKIDVTYDIFIQSGLMCIAIVLLTVAFHSIKTSMINPAKLLRDE